MAIEESLQRGIGLVGQGMLHQALSIFEDILKDYPDEPRVLYNAAVINNRLGYRDRALGLLQRSIDADSSFANPYYYLVVIGISIFFDSPLKRGDKGVCKFAATPPQPLW